MTKASWQAGCAVPSAGGGNFITLGHGEGGRLSRRLVEERIVPVLGNRWLESLDDAAQLPSGKVPLAFTTDSYVVSPIFFPGGDIGKLAICGTVNDLGVMGAVPRWISLGLILEEGFPLAKLDRVLTSLADSARESGVSIVAGDTKVVPRGAADGVFINTAGIGEFVEPPFEGPRDVEAGDELFVSGPIAQHGVAVLAAREELGFEPAPESDCASLLPVVEALRSANIPVRCLRDATRGGVAAVLYEWTESGGVSVVVDEAELPISGEVRGVCELLGLDPLHLACEGTLVGAVPEGWGERAIDAMRSCSVGAGARRVGSFRSRSTNAVVVRRSLGSEQPLDAPLGAPLPRLC